MFQLFLGFLLFIFGIFLKLTKEQGFAKSKRFWWMFVLIGILSMVAQIFIMKQKGEL